jgi:hypothetical protein
MNTPQHIRAATSHLCDAAHIIERRHDLEAARTPLIDAVLETLGNDARLREIVDLVLRAMDLQRAACRDEIL